MGMFYGTLLLFALQSQADFRANVRLVRVDAEVSQDAMLIEGLDQEDFRIRDGGRPREILYFGRAEEPLDLILVFDTSASMLPAVERIAEVSRAALGELRPADRVAVMAFDADTDLIADFTGDFDRVQAVIQNDVVRRTFIPNSQLQPAARDAAQHFLRQPRSNRRRAVLIVTDNKGSSREERALPDLWEADVVLSGLIVPGMAMRTRLLFPPIWFGFGSITEMAERTGGTAVKVGDPGTAFRQMIERLRLRYSLHYEMPEAKPGAERTITVELSEETARRYRGAKVRARRGYIVPGP
jgi:VWFA-related protein